MAQRVLLVTDGTLTDTVEALYGEPIGLRKVALEIGPAADGSPALCLEPGAEVMQRSIVLYGGRSGRNYVYAESQLALDRLPAAFREGLLETDTPLGRLWSQFRIETWKELLFAGVVVASGKQQCWFPDCSNGLVKRSYRMISGGLPLMVITEYFPR